MSQRRRRDRVALLGAGIVCIALTFALGFYVAAGGAEPPGLDASWMDDVVGLRADVVLFASNLFNHIGGGWFAILVVPIGGAVAFVFARRPWSALVFIVASAVSAGLCQVLKALFGRARPEEILLPLHNGSFPSGHATNAAVIAAVLGLLLRRTWVWVLGAIYIVAMAFSRTLLGAHWVSDTVAGALLGVGTALIVYWAFLPQLRTEPVGGAPTPAQRSGSAARSRT
ncbi:phosphatase PAP2 family protein [Salinibacterium sp. ZJ77]|uniref:phosphatase PAP2 family protein n=1 Tax=Salinibacterium sp. ZJ77 TaxID=2708337 RepID=UPI00142157AF|nr:phosphatase PAP2 family protein [Salinibacterium sp. ZJ77]